MICDGCGEEPATGVYAMPYMPCSRALGPKCLEAGVIPLDSLIAVTASRGGMEAMNRFVSGATVNGVHIGTAGAWEGFVSRSLARNGKTREWFDAEVAKVPLP